MAFYAEEIGGEDHSLIADLMSGISGLQGDYRAAWLSEYTPHALRAALLKWDHEYEYWWGMQRKLSKLQSDYREGAVLPALESFDSGPITK